MKTELSDLGTRICIIGPSNSGKSTLADRLADKVGGQVCHLDQLAHKPHTNWERRPEEDFISDHNIFIRQDVWVIDGNYSICMPQRFERSTAVIWLDLPLIGFLWRYIARSVKNDPNRIGNLSGAKGQFSFGLIKYTFFRYPKNRKTYENLLSGYKNTFIRIGSMKELNKCYADWGLKI